MLRVGVDCEEIPRFRKYPYRQNVRFYNKIFTPQEQSYCMSHRDPYPRFAVRFAAKEAVIKALNGIAKPAYSDIEIRNNKKGQPLVYINSKCAARVRPFTVSVSLSHSRTHAIAFVIVTTGRSTKQKRRVKRLLDNSVTSLNEKGSKKNFATTFL